MDMPITSFSIRKYVEQTYGKISNFNYKNIGLKKAFLQNEFGGTEDCALVSLLTVLNYYIIISDLNNVYNLIEKIAKKYCFSNNYGIILPFYKKIIIEIFNYYKLPVSLIRQHKFKELNWNFKNIINSINNKKPILLSIHKDKYNYYKNHTVVVDGYYEYIINNKKIYMLQIRDNWNNQITYVDYQKLDILTSIITF